MREFRRRLTERLLIISLILISPIRHTRSTIREGIKSDRVIKIGSPMKEVLDAYSKRIAKSDILKKLGVKKYKYFVLSCHREENIELNFKK